MVEARTRGIDKNDVSLEQQGPRDETRVYDFTLPERRRLK